MKTTTQTYKSKAMNKHAYLFLGWLLLTILTLTACKKKTPLPDPEKIDKYDTRYAKGEMPYMKVGAAPSEVLAAEEALGYRNSVPNNTPKDVLPSLIFNNTKGAIFERITYSPYQFLIKGEIKESATERFLSTIKQAGFESLDTQTYIAKELAIELKVEGLTFAMRSIETNGYDPNYILGDLPYLKFGMGLKNAEKSIGKRTLQERKMTGVMIYQAVQAEELIQKVTYSPAPIFISAWGSIKAGGVDLFIQQIERLGFIRSQKGSAVWILKDKDLCITVQGNEFQMDRTSIKK